MAQKRELPPQSAESITTKVVERLSMVEGVDPLELHPPLQSVVDLDAVEDLFSPGADDQPKGEVCISFVYNGHHVTIDGGDEVDVRVKKRSSN